MIFSALPVLILNLCFVCSRCFFLFIFIEVFIYILVFFLHCFFLLLLYFSLLSFVHENSGSSGWLNFKLCTSSMVQQFRPVYVALSVCFLQYFSCGFEALTRGTTLRMHLVLSEKMESLLGAIRT